MIRYVCSLILLTFPSYTLHAQSPHKLSIEFIENLYDCIYKGMPSHYNAEFSHYDYDTLHEINSFKTQYHTSITVLQDQYYNKCLVKQYVASTLIQRIVAARDKLGSRVAQSVNVLANHVEIIPINYSFPGKHDPRSVATLHTFVSGTTIRDLPETSTVFQGSLKQEHKNNTPKNQRGLTRNIITTMSQHPDLCKMVALDTFIANTDRHTANFMYDSTNDRFIAIDLENSFHSNLGYYACQLIIALINNKNILLNTQELNALSIYKNTLELLIASHTPQALYESFVAYVEESGTIPRGLNGFLEHHVQNYRATIQANYNSCVQLVGLLDQLIIVHQ